MEAELEFCENGRRKGGGWISERMVEFSKEDAATGEYDRSKIVHNVKGFFAVEGKHII